MFTANPFMGIRRGASVTFTVKRPGTGNLRQVKVAKVNPLLIFDDHVQVNLGPFGTRVDADNYLSHLQRQEA